MSLMSPIWLADVLVIEIQEDTVLDLLTHGVQGLSTHNIARQDFHLCEFSTSVPRIGRLAPNFLFPEDTHTHTHNVMHKTIQLQVLCSRFWLIEDFRHVSSLNPASAARGPLFYGLNSCSEREKERERTV